MKRGRLNFSSFRRIFVDLEVFLEEYIPNWAEVLKLTRVFEYVYKKWPHFRKLNTAEMDRFYTLHSGSNSVLFYVNTDRTKNPYKYVDKVQSNTYYPLQVVDSNRLSLLSTINSTRVIVSDKRWASISSKFYEWRGYTTVIPDKLLHEVTT